MLSHITGRDACPISCEALVPGIGFKLARTMLEERMQQVEEDISTSSEKEKE